MGVRYLNPEPLHRNLAFSQAAVIDGPGRTIHIGGQNAVDATGRVVGAGDLRAQAEQVLRNLEAALGAAGADTRHIVHWTVHIVDGQSPDPAFEVFQRVLAGREDPPLITMAYVAALAHPDFLMELSALAFVPDGGGRRSDP